MSIFVETVSPGSELLLAGEILDWLASAESTPSCRGLIVAAHPDDEVIGLSSRLPLLSRSCFIHVTDGAPRNLQDAQAHGYSTCEEYAGARRMEFFNSLRLAGIKDACYRCLEFPDQE